MVFCWACAYTYLITHTQELSLKHVEQIVSVMSICYYKKGLYEVAYIAIRDAPRHTNKVYCGQLDFQIDFLPW